MKLKNNAFDIGFYKDKNGNYHREDIAEMILLNNKIYYSQGNFEIEYRQFVYNGEIFYEIIE